MLGDPLGWLLGDSLSSSSTVSDSACTLLSSSRSFSP